MCLRQTHLQYHLGQLQTLGNVCPSSRRSRARTPAPAPWSASRPYARQATGSTFKQLVNIERMRRAALLLRGTTRPIYEIAEEVGLSGERVRQIKHSAIEKMRKLAVAEHLTY